MFRLRGIAVQGKPTQPGILSLGQGMQEDVVGVFP